LLHGKAEWQAASGPAELVWRTGMDAPLRYAIVALVFVAAAMVWAYIGLARAGGGQPLLKQNGET
jgi:hypothetical protein